MIRQVLCQLNGTLTITVQHTLVMVLIRNVCNYIISFITSVMATYSASQLDKSTIFCNLNTQEITVSLNV